MPTTDSLPMGEAFSTGFNKFKENALLLIAVTVIAGALPAFVTRVGQHIHDSWLLDVAGWAVTVTLELGVISIAIRILNEDRVELANLFDVFPRVPFAIVASFVASIAVAFGLLLLLVPGIIVALRLQFVGYAILEGHGPIESIQRSWEMTRGFGLDLFLLALLMLAVFVLGVICLLVGTLVALPVMAIAQAFVYRFLKARYEARYPAAAQA